MQIKLDCAAANHRNTFQTLKAGQCEKKKKREKALELGAL